MKRSSWLFLLGIEPRTFLHEAGEFTHSAKTNSHPFSYKKAFFNMPYGITCSHVYDNYMMQLLQERVAL